MNGRWLLTVLTDPAGTFAGVRERPRLLVPWVSQAVALAFSALVLLPRVREALQARLLTAPGVPEGMAIIARRVAFFTVVLSPSLVLIVSWLIWGFILWLASRHLEEAASYLAHVAMAAYAAVPATLGAIARAAITLWLPGHEVAETSVAVLLPPPEGSPSLLYTALARLDPFALWTLGLTVIGYAAINRLPRRRAAAVVAGLWLAGVVLGLAVAALRTRLPGLGWR